MEIIKLTKIVLLLLIIKVCNTMTSITWEEALQMVRDRDQEDKVAGGGEPPQRLNSSSMSCPCNKLLLSSLGPAATVLPRVMGTYTRSD